MGRVFTITPGLENMGGLKTGGQGSIYKGKRIGEIITAVKILPTPIYSESGEDNNYSAFLNEVAKLKRVNEVPNPYVVKILSSGLSEQGNFPYIEMEYIEGPDLQELLQVDGHSVFTIKETLKVAEQLSEAIAHCHRMDVRHGDIKSNNVKLNSNSGNFILLDFGLAVISDEQRKSTLSQLGAIEFMAPEQNSGQMLFQTDVYSFGVVLYELLAGTVPFSLKTDSDAARNEVRLAHMVSPIPNILQRREAALPFTWSSEKKKLEMDVPGWLIRMIEKCLEKKPEDRFKNGIDLHNFFHQQRLAGSVVRTGIDDLSVKRRGMQDLLKNNEHLKKQLADFQQDLIKKENELSTLKGLLSENGAKAVTINNNRELNGSHPKSNRVSITSFALLMFLTLALASFSMYPLIKRTFFVNPPTASEPGRSGSKNSVTKTNAASTSDTREINRSSAEKVDMDKEANIVLQRTKNAVDASAAEVKKPSNKPIETNANENVVDSYIKKEKEESGQGDRLDENANGVKQSDKAADQVNDGTNPGKNGVTKKYLVVSKAYFHDEPNENVKRNEFISPLDKAVVQGLNERYGFVYVVITNPQGQAFKGWLRKSDLKLYSIE